MNSCQRPFPVFAHSGDLFPWPGDPGRVGGLNQERLAWISVEVIRAGSNHPLGVVSVLTERRDLAGRSTEPGEALSTVPRSARSSRTIRPKSWGSFSAPV